jgi:hypothetical protein
VSLVASTGPSRVRSQHSLLVSVGTTFRTDTRVFNPNRPDRTSGVRYRFTGPVRPEIGGNRKNSNFKPNSLVQAVQTGIPNRFDRFPVV